MPGMVRAPLADMPSHKPPTQPKPPMRGRRQQPNWPLRGVGADRIRRSLGPRRAERAHALLYKESSPGGSMADDLKQTAKPDDPRINIDRDPEVSYWANELGVSPNELRQAVEDAGPMVKDVRQHLNR